ncbi:MAG: alpha/beta fold hydrolase [Culicoidibacterales bacterium]
MSKTLYLDNGEGGLFLLRVWSVDAPLGCVQIVHGMGEHSGRYEAFARFLNYHNIYVVATDHRGHGQTAKDVTEIGYIGEAGFEKMVADEYLALLYTRSQVNDVPYIVLGHSMGSFIAQNFIEKYSHKIDGCILSGSNGLDPLVKLGGKLAQIWEWFNQDKRSKLLAKILTGNFNAKTEKRTAFDWLAVDKTVVDEYIEDKFCGAIFPPSFYRQLMAFLVEIAEREQRLKIRKELPIFIAGGSCDPVGLYGKGLDKLGQQYQEVGLTNIAVKMYTKSRHEILNDIEKREVYADIISWLRHLGMK